MINNSNNLLKHFSAIFLRQDISDPLQFSLQQINFKTHLLTKTSFHPNNVGAHFTQAHYFLESDLNINFAALKYFFP